MDIAVITILGIFFALSLSLVSYKFYVERDEREEKIEEILPGANCGGCGFAGCAAYAHAIVHQNADITLCAPGGEKVIKKIGEIMGKEVKNIEKKVAILKCSTPQIKRDSIYEGIKDCRSAYILLQGNTACAYGCLGLGTCVKECPFGALSIKDGSVPEVDEEKCTGCGHCVEVCPRGLFEVVSVKKMVHVRCSSLDKGKDVIKVCEIGCIGCGKCVKVCKFDAIKVENNIARIDYEKCVSCGACVKACPRGVIFNYRKKRKKNEKEI